MFFVNGSVLVCVGLPRHSLLPQRSLGRGTDGDGGSVANLTQLYFFAALR